MTNLSITNRPPSPSPSLRYLPESDTLEAERQRPVEEIALSHYLWLFRRYALRIALVVISVAVLTVIYCYRVRPAYEAVTRITLDQRMPATAIGQPTQPGGASDSEQLITTEMQIIQSDYVVRPVAEEFHLQTSKASKDVKGASSQSDTDNDLGEAPVVIPNLSVTHPPNSLLIDIHYRATSAKQAAAVANAIAQSYILRSMESRAHASSTFSEFMEKQISQLKRNMDDSATALAGYERQMGVINPDEKVSILTARVLQLNTQYTEAQNDRISKETEYKAIQSGAAGSTSGAALEVSAQASALRQQEQQLHEAQEKFAVAKTVYGPNYAEYKRAANDVAELTRQYEQMRADIFKRIEASYHQASSREEMLQNALRDAKDESDRLNAHSQEYQELKREAEANKTLYDELYRKIKEAGINSGIESGAIRIADSARPPARPVFPKKTLLVSVASIFALIVSLLVVLVMDLFDRTLRDPEQALRLTGMQVLGVLPKVQGFPTAYVQLALEDAHGGVSLVRTGPSKNSTSSEEFYRESVASLLNTLRLSSPRRKLDSILVTSASPGDGKSSCAANLALENARLGKKTLLVDADMRSPFQHRYFELKNENGLYGVITNHDVLTNLCQKIPGTPMLDVIVSGPSNTQIFRHVGRGVSELLDQAAKEDYDLVIVDAPPMVGLTEPIEIACLTDGVLVIGDANATSQPAVSAVHAALVRVHANVLGLVLNRFRPNSSQSYKQYQSYSIYAGRQAGQAA